MKHHGFTIERSERSPAAQFPRNLAANIAYFLVNIIIGLALVPYFVNTLGVAAYGIIPLATSITGYVAIVVQSLNTAVSRFLTIDLQRGDYVTANKTFNTAFFSLTVAILLMVPLTLIVAYFSPSIFQVPTGQEASVIFLFLGVSVAFLIRSWSGNFTVQLFAFNRLDFQNIINIINLLVQTGLIVILFTIRGPDLALVGGAYLIGAVVASLVSIFFARRVCPQLRISIKSFDCSRVRDLSGMGWWIVINQIGSLLFLQIDLIVVNLLFGELLAGEYAIVLQWVTLLRAVGGVLSGVLTPTILSYYARGQTDSLIRVSKSAVKLMGLAIALPVGLVCGLAPQLLTVWVGGSFTFLASLMVLLTIHLTVNLSVLPLFSINVAYNKVRLPGIVTLIMGIGNLGLAIALPLTTGWGYYGVAAAGAIVLTIKNAFFTPWYATRVLGVSGHAFTRSMLPGIVATIAIGLLTAIIGTILSLDVLFVLAMVGASVALAYVMAVWAFGLNEFERRLFTSYLPSALRRMFV